MIYHVGYWLVKQIVKSRIKEVVNFYIATENANEKLQA